MRENDAWFGHGSLRWWEEGGLTSRNLVERFFNKIKHCRRVATRYDKLAANYLALGYRCALMSPRPNDDPVARSPLGIRCENIILCCHRRVAGVAALRALYAWLERVGRGVVIKLGKCPPVRGRKPFGVLFDERERLQSIRDVHKIGRLQIPFER